MLLGGAIVNATKRNDAENVLALLVSFLLLLFLYSHTKGLGAS